MNISYSYLNLCISILEFKLQCLIALSQEKVDLCISILEFKAKNEA